MSTAALVRTPEMPMRFTFAEFLPGALVAMGVIFLGTMIGFAWQLLPELDGTSSMSVNGGPLLTGAALYWSHVRSFALIIAIFVVGGSVMFFGVIWAAGRMLMRTGRLRIHLLCYTVLGATLGFLVTYPGLLIWLPPASPARLGAALSITAAIPLGWWAAASRALRRDRVRA